MYPLYCFLLSIIKINRLFQGQLNGTLKKWDLNSELIRKESYKKGELIKK